MKTAFFNPRWRSPGEIRGSDTMKESCGKHPADRDILPLVRVAEVQTAELHGPACAPTSERAFSASAGALRLRLPDATTGLLLDGRASSRMELLLRVSPFGTPVICAAMQSGGTQVRAVLNGCDDRARQWLNSVLMFERACLCIDTERAGLPAWMSFDLISAEKLAASFARQRAPDLSASLAAIEMSEAAVQLAAAEAVPTLIEGQAIETLVIAVVRPCARQAGVQASERWAMS
ncbi:hypothetical protein M8A51_00165 [Schlegelella sp. S2-27]|uniref:Aminomethyltransferase folate-binding domain-containing protein n=1 Tax=Caldimonas mangrovi TaxID=2944811 RepID=A0ABT0YIB6_9BURK|nr:hypothetical protein [Caldimonas mangrovi]MCM5677942.1 hypothetical protein [Caldimonas mangrovi]